MRQKLKSFFPLQNMSDITLPSISFLAVHQAPKESILTMTAFQRAKARSAWTPSNWELKNIAKSRRLLFHWTDTSETLELRIRSSNGDLHIYSPENELLDTNEILKIYPNTEIEVIIKPTGVFTTTISIDVRLESAVVDTWMEYLHWDMKCRNHKYELSKKTKREHQINEDAPSFQKVIVRKG